MRTVFGLDGLEPAVPGAAVTIGTFDGVHLGHRSLMARTVELAGANGLVSMVITWDRHPFETLRPERVPPLLTTAERRTEAIESVGVDALAILAFDTELSSWPPERFAADVIAKKVGGRAVVVGKGWRFGHGAVGDVGLLTSLGDELGFTVTTMDLTDVGGEPVSSSRARSAVAAGDMELARALLGRPYDMDGREVRGAGRGASLGYPTANLEHDPTVAVPARGAYAGRARARGEWFAAAVSVGVAPTFGGDSAVTVEAHLLDFNADLYDETLRVEFWKHLHDDVAFASVADLVAQIDADVDATRALAGRPAPAAGTQPS
jgi:riboflavin kinase/FMN adenylyltransferase